MGISQTRAENVIMLFLLVSCLGCIYIFIHFNCLCFAAVTLRQVRLFSGGEREKVEEAHEHSRRKFGFSIDLNESSCVVGSLIHLTTS